MTRTIGILLFDGAEELDFVGPWEVFTMSNAVADLTARTDARHEVFFVSQNGGMVTGAKGMQVLAMHDFESCPKLDIVLVPGGQGTRAEVDNPRLLEWIADVARDCEWVTSVCTGSLLLGAAGPARGKRVTTHWGFVEGLRSRGDVAEVRDDVRYVRDGNVLTSSGVSAGIDMTLWLIGQLYGPEHARRTQRAMQYDPAPPYAGDV